MIDILDDRFLARSRQQHITPTDLLTVAAALIQLAAEARRSAQLAAIAEVALGHVPAHVADAVPAEAFDGPAMLLAWVCACRAARALGPRVSFRAVHAVLRSVPLDRGLPPGVAEELQDEAAEELDEAEWWPVRRGTVEAMLEEHGMTVAMSEVT